MWPRHHFPDTSGPYSVRRRRATEPTTQTFAASELLPYFYGGRTVTSDVTKYKTNARNQSLHFRIRGTDATLKADGGATQPYWVSVDGGAETNPTVTGGKITLLSGATQAVHTVNIRLDNAYTGGNGWVTVAADTLEVTGVSPSHSADPDYGAVQIFLDGDAGSESLFGSTASGANGGVAPEVPQSLGCDSYRFTATVESGRPIWVWSIQSNEGSVLLETDGVPGTVAFPASVTNRYAWMQVGTGDGTEHEYTVVVNRSVGADAVMLGGATSAFSTATLATRPYVLLLGDSTTAGDSCSGQNSMDSHGYLVAKQVGANVANRAISGENTGQVSSAIASRFALLPATPDAAIVLLSFNDNLDGSTTQTPYTAILDYLIANISGGIVSSPLYTATGNVSLINAARAAAVAGCTTPARVYTATAVGTLTSVTFPTVPTSSQVQTCDGLHPTGVGGATIAANELSAVGDALGI